MVQSKTVLQVALATGMLLFAAQAAHAEETTMKRTISVSATGSVSVDPDLARISSGVVEEAASAGDALAANNKAMTDVIAAVKELGIDGKDIQTSQFNIRPLRHSRSKSVSPGVPEISGYEASNQITIIVRDLGKVGPVIDAMISAGANNMNNLSFDASNSDVLKDEARKQAVANARRRAELLAEAAGAKIGKILTLSEESFSAMPVARARFAAESAAAPTPVEAGSLELEARVSATWALE